MSLKKIEIYGFKSFADHTVIEIDENQNFVCIVGPNGCGKSNISDAIRWVLGEASAKQIRGNNMRDVIFSGTEKIKAMNFAEVTLFFDNPLRENGQRVFNYAGEEFSIGRKIFRSKGDNIYYFNGKQCRRAEIMALFRDTGAGKDGFSIVGQGRISDIIISKNTDRRKIFDEAAGVSNDKARKKDTVKKLDDINQNLRLLEANYDYYAEDIARLEEEVEKANKYIEVVNKIKDLEVNYFIHIKESIDSDKAKIQSDIDNNTEYLQKQETGIAEVKRKLVRLEQETVEIDESIERAYNLREQLKVSSVKRDSEYTKYQNDVKNKKDTLKRLTSDRDLALAEIERLKAESEKTQSDINELKTQKSDAEISMARTKAEYDMLDADIKGLQNTIDIYSEKRLSGVEDISVFKSLEASASASIQGLEENIVNTQKSIDEAKQSIIEDNAKCDELTKKINETQKNIDFADNEKRSSAPLYNNLRYQKNDTAVEYNKLIEVVTMQKSRVDSLLERLKDERGYNKSTRAVLEKAKADPSFGAYVLGAVGDLFTVDDKYYDAISASLGGSVNNILTEDKFASQKVLEYVKSLHIGRLTTYPLSDINGERLARMYQSVLDMPGVVGLACDLIKFNSKYESIYTQLLGKIVVVDSFKTASDLRNRYPRCFKMVTLNGEFFDISGSISGGDNKTGTEQQLQRARAEYEQSRARLAELGAKHKEIEEKSVALEQKLERIRSSREKYSVDLMALQTEKTSIVNTIAMTEKKRIDLESQLTIYKTRLQEKQLEISEAQSKSGAVSSDRTNIDSLIESKKSTLLQKQSDFAVVSEKLKSLEISVSTLSEQLRQAETNIDRLNRSVSDKGAMIESLDVDVQRTQGELEELQNNAPQLVMSEDETKKIDEITEEIARYNKRKSEISGLKESLNVDAENFNQRIVKVSKDLSALSTKLESIDNEVIEWSNTIETNYGLDYESALPYKREDYEHSKAKSELSKLTAVKNRMGAVNLNAEETYKQKKVEFDQLKTNLEDAKTARDDTQTLLVKISQEIDKKFGLAFMSIAEFFQQTFSDLFGGGKAELMLTPSEIEGEDDGVDIAVTLPGKNKKSLSLLSGGEQTLTAIAIIFAILRYRSSPFVILDEVESALDESNCVRFALYLKEFSKLARFIVISHKKPTMEEADVLYGVTMMRPGISNIVSVSMDEAQKMSEDNQ